MLKWILGIIAAIVLLLAGTCYVGYRKLTSGGNTATVTVAATPEHLWLLFTFPDSMRAWQDSTATLTMSSDSMLSEGDTVRIRSGSAGDRVRSDMQWVLERAEQPALLVWSTRDDSVGVEIARRTDSLVAVGDSVRIVSVFTTPGLDSLSSRDSTSGIGRSLINAGGRVAAGGMRLVAQMELDRLRARLQ